MNPHNRQVLQQKEQVHGLLQLQLQRLTTSSNPQTMITPPPRNFGESKRSVSRSKSNSRLSSKQDLLSRFQDKEESGGTEDDVFGDPYDDTDNIFQEKLDDPYYIENEFQTLKISNSPKFNTNSTFNTINGTSKNHNNDNKTIKLSKGKATLSPHNDIMKYVESPENIDSFDEDFLDIDEIQPTLKTKQPIQPPQPIELKFSPSPTTISTSSPKRRKSLSEYSEDTNETDVTSQFNDDDFEDIDDIFGNEESGLYKDEKSHSSIQEVNNDKIKQHLLMKQKKLQIDAEIEERELYKKYQKANYNKDDEINTIKLKDFTNYQNKKFKEDNDVLENDKTIKYEYTRDEFDIFEDGFDFNGPILFDSKKLKQFSNNQGNEFNRKNSNIRLPSINPKMSMPNFNRLNSNNKSMKKYKSSINLAKEYEDEFEVNEHPVFNNNNKIIRKLDRIPSFYHKNNNNDNNNNNENQQMNNDIELQKQQLLNKFMEISEKQKRMNNGYNYNNDKNQSPNKANKKHSLSSPQRNSTKKIGLVRNLNDKSVPLDNNKNNKMKYNPLSKKWEGNDIELIKFENLSTSNLKSQNFTKPGLITNQKFNNKDKKIQGNMVFDPDELRWINLNNNEIEDVFKDLPNLDSDQFDSPTRKQSFAVYGHNNNQKQSPLRNGSTRGISQFTQRTTSSSTNTNSEEDEEFQEGESNNEEDSSLIEGWEFNLSENLINTFYNEEKKISRKINNWFDNTNQFYKIDNNNNINIGNDGKFNNNYFWEIRKMVVDDNEDDDDN